MASYSIKDLERISGIKAHTIRIWEQRYQVLNPERTETNIRTYTNQDLKTILNLACLNKNGYKISKLSEMSPESLVQLVKETTQGLNADHELIIEQLMVAMIDLNEAYFDEVLQNHIESSSFDETIQQIIYPFFERIGVLWQIGTITPAQEHFVSNLIRQKLIAAIDGIKSTPKDAKLVMAFLREDEWHELGLLYYTFVTKKEGYKVIYLGQSTPLQDAIAAIEMKNPDYILTAFVQPLDAVELNKLVADLAKSFGKKELWISGIQAEKIIDQPKNAKIFDSVLSFKKHLKSL